MIPQSLPAMGSAMANHVWQSTVFAVVAALLVLALRENRARIRYSLWLIASLKFLVPFSLLMSLGAHLAGPRAQASAPSALYSAVEEVSQPFTPAVVPAAPTVVRAAGATHLFSLPLALLAVAWLCGFVAVLGLWWFRWRRISAVIREAAPIAYGREVDALRQLERAARMRKPIVFLLSQSFPEPGIFGIVRPVLFWPAGISEHLQDGHLEALLAHEVCHVRRRDNLAAAVHMVVEAIFWFHPFVWWLGARLIEEREGACDEEVLQLGNPPQVYAESILKTCEFCVRSPLACISGVSGAGLRNRIVRIMTGCVPSKLDFRRKLLLTVAGLLAVGVPIVFGERNVPQSHVGSQAGNSAANLPAFDVASIKLNKSGTRLFRARFTPDGFSATNTSLLMLLRLAYELSNSLDDQFIGTPTWVKSERYDIEAKVNPSDVAELSKLSMSQRRLMLQALLVDRFKLTAHRETRELPVYVLLIAKNGPKLRDAKPDDIYPNTMKGPDGRRDAGTMAFRTGHIEAQAVPMNTLVSVLTQELGRTVLDKAELTGKYDVTLQWAPDADQAQMFKGPGNAGATTDDTPPPPETSGPSIFTAIQEQLGLKLESQKGPVEGLVIDHVERPSEN